MTEISDKISIGNWALDLKTWLGLTGEYYINTMIDCIHLNKTRKEIIDTLYKAKEKQTERMMQVKADCVKKFGY